MRFIVKRIKSVLTSSKFLGFQGFLMSAETMAPWRGFPKTILQSFVSWPFWKSCLSVDCGKSTSLCFVWQSHDTGCPLGSSATSDGRWISALSSLPYILHLSFFLFILVPKLSTLRKDVILFQLSVYPLSFSSRGKL